MPNVILGLKGPEELRKKTAEWEYKWEMESKCTSQFCDDIFFFFVLVCLLPPTYMLSSFVHCLPPWIWNANYLLSARNILTLFLLSISPSPLLAFVCLPHFLCVFSSSFSSHPLVPSILSEFLSFPSVSQGQSFFFYHMHTSTVSGKEIFSLQFLNRQSNK